MNLLMLILIFLAVWVCGAICYFAWRLTPDPDAERQELASRSSSVAATNPANNSVSDSEG